MKNKEQILDILNDIKDDLGYTQVTLVECNRDYIECPLCGSTASVTYEQGSANKTISMSSIDHEDCAYGKISEAINLLEENNGN